MRLRALQRPGETRRLPWFLHQGRALRARQRHLQRPMPVHGPAADPRQLLALGHPLHGPEGKSQRSSRQVGSARRLQHDHRVKRTSDEGSAKPRITQGPDGSQLVTLDLGSSDASGHCAPKEYCYCPSPMKVTTNPVYINGVKQDYGIVLCNCPDGTHAARLSGSNGNQPTGPLANLTYCICNNTGKPMATGPDLPFGNCPTIGTNGCPQGQISIGSKCVTPCADPTEGRPTTDGKCCDPAQESRLAASAARRGQPGSEDRRLPSPIRQPRSSRRS